MNNKKKWHPQASKHGGNGGPRNDFKEWWKFPCCNKIVFSDNEPSQERDDGCKVKN